MITKAEEQLKQYPFLKDKLTEMGVKSELDFKDEAFIIPKDATLTPTKTRIRRLEAPITAYLAGPMEGMTYEEAADWRDLATFLLIERGMRAKNPMVRDYRELFANGGYIPGEKIVEPDKNDILQSDAIIVWYSEKSTGTAMEVIWAYYWGIPIIVIAVKNPISPWIDYHATTIVETVEEAVEYLYDLSMEF